MKILIMGLPGAGKTTLAQQLVHLIRRQNKTVIWYNADEVRRIYKDWDFSKEGRLRQASRMKEFADLQTSDFVICDFVAPLLTMREIFEPDFVVWVDTIEEGKYADTNLLFEPPQDYNVRVTTQDASVWAEKIVNYLK